MVVLCMLLGEFKYWSHWTSGQSEKFASVAIQKEFKGDSAQWRQTKDSYQHCNGSKC